MRRVEMATLVKQTISNQVISPSINHGHHDEDEKFENTEYFRMIETKFAPDRALRRKYFDFLRASTCWFQSETQFQTFHAKATHFWEQNSGKRYLNKWKNFLTGKSNWLSWICNQFKFVFFCRTQR